MAEFFTTFDFPPPFMPLAPKNWTALGVISEATPQDVFEASAKSRNAWSSVGEVHSENGSFPKPTGLLSLALLKGLSAAKKRNYVSVTQFWWDFRPTSARFWLP